MYFLLTVLQLRYSILGRCSEAQSASHKMEVSRSFLHSEMHFLEDVCIYESTRGIVLSETKLETVVI